MKCMLMVIRYCKHDKDKKLSLKKKILIKLMKIHLLLNLVRCYNSKVHGHLANLLPDVLSKTAYSRTIGVLNGTSLYEASIWADKIKRTKKYAFTRTMHYINIDGCSVTLDEIPYTKSGTIYEAITELTTGNGDRFSHLTDKERLMFLIHFLGDISQPLHVIAKDRGGNSVKIIRNKNGRNSTTNLHTLWDSEIPQTLLSSGLYTPTLKNVSLINIVNFNLKVGCNHVYNFEDGYILFEDYYKENIVREMFDNYISLCVSYL